MQLICITLLMESFKDCILQKSDWKRQVIGIWDSFRDYATNEITLIT
jgi:hypothetical protein